MWTKLPKMVQFSQLRLKIRIREALKNQRKIREKPRASERIRTSDPLITNQLLYRLSYAGPLIGGHSTDRK